MKRRLRAPSPALVIALIALFVALGGTSYAASKVIVTKHKDAKADTKLVKKLAPSLSVKHASTADTATNATNAGVLTGADASNLVAGYATINPGTTPTVMNFGGKRVTSVTVSQVSTGNYQVTFNGNFPGVTSINQVATFASMWNTDTFDVASASNDQSSASSSAISIRVFTWSTANSPSTVDDRQFSVMIMTP